MKKKTQAISYKTVSGSENERFRVAQPVWLAYRPETGDFSGFRYQILLWGRPQPEEGGPFSDEIPARKWHPELVLHLSWEATNLVTSGKQ